MEFRYYSLIRSTREGLLVGWIPDLPGVTASSFVDEDVVSELSRGARELLRKIAGKGLPIPPSSSADSLPFGDRQGPYRKLLLVIC